MFFKKKLLKSDKKYNCYEGVLFSNGQHCIYQVVFKVRGATVHTKVYNLYILT